MEGAVLTHRVRGIEGGDTYQNTAQLPATAKAELRAILTQEAGPEAVERLSDDEIEHFGMFLLTIHAEAAKMRAINRL